METTNPTFKYYRIEKPQALTREPSLKAINPMDESRVLVRSKDKQAELSEKRIAELVDTYNKQVALSLMLKDRFRVYQKESPILKQLEQFRTILPNQKCQDLIQRLSCLLDTNSKLKKEIEKWQTRQQIQRRFGSSKSQYLWSSTGYQQAELMEQKITRQKPDCFMQFLHAKQLQSPISKPVDKQTDESEDFSESQANISFTNSILSHHHTASRFTHMRASSNLIKDKGGFGSILKSVKHIWEKESEEGKSKTWMAMDKLDEFVQDLNKKVVMTRVKINELTVLEKSSLLDEGIKVCTNEDCMNGKTQEMRNELKEMKLKISEYERKVQEMQKKLEQKDKVINELNQTISKLNSVKDEEIKIKVSSNFNSPHKLLTTSLKHLSLDIDQINSDSSSSSEHVIANSSQSYGTSLKTSPVSNLNKSELETLPSTDPVFSIPCLSPTMIQMKSIEKIQAQRRRKLRQMKRDPTGTKTLVHDLNNMAAGIPSSLSQQLIKQAINPAKNRFIRKPLSPMMGSMYLLNKSSNAITQTSIIVENQELPSNKEQKQIKESEEKPQAEPSLGTPFFSSVKKSKQEK